MPMLLLFLLRHGTRNREIDGAIHVPRLKLRLWLLLMMRLGHNDVFVYSSSPVSRIKATRVAR